MLWALAIATAFWLALGVLAVAACIRSAQNTRMLEGGRR